METNRKVRIAVNYYTKNTLRRYFYIWKKYVNRKQRFMKKLTNLKRNSSIDAKPDIQLNPTIQTTIFQENYLKKIEIVKKEEVLLPTDFISNNILTTNDEINKQLIQLCIHLMSRVFRLWKKYSIFVLNKKKSSTNIEVHQIEQLHNNENNRKNIIIIYRTLLLLKTTWKIWYKYSI